MIDPNDIIYIEIPDVSAPSPWWEKWSNVVVLHNPFVINDHIYNLKSIVAKVEHSWPYIIIATHNGDGGLYHSPDPNVFYTGCTLEIYNDVVLPDQVYHIFSTNLNVVHPRMTALPYGVVDNRQLVSSDTAKHMFTDYYSKDILCYARFSTWTFPNKRHEICQWCKDMSFITSDFSTHMGEQTPQTLDNYFVNLHRSKFTICPPGNGPDTLRVWEALYAGSIPIVLDCPLYRNFQELPMLRVQKFTDINADILEAVYDQYQETMWNLNLLRLSYYNRLFQETYQALKKLL